MSTTKRLMCFCSSKCQRLPFNLFRHFVNSVAMPSILIWKISHVHHRINFARIIEWIFLELSNEFCSNHRMNIAKIIEWMLLELFHKCRGESNAYQGEFIEFCYNFIECIDKIKYIWILFSICGNYQTHIRDIEYWHISATKVEQPKISIRKWTIRFNLTMGFTLGLNSYSDRGGERVFIELN